MKSIFSILILVVTTNIVLAQGSPPWKNPVMIARSTNGINFNTPVIFQDSSGVPCVVRWKGDTLIATFQWFRQPMGSLTWDRVAVKFSYDAGNTWTNPFPIVVNGLPPNYQRPFDPTLTITADKKIRIYYSSSNGMPMPGADSIINTYSAISTDGINYSFESGPRYDHPTKKVIDPAVVDFKNTWHYISPAGAPQEGAHHCTSADGLSFTPQPIYPSDNNHNWTGNFVVAGINELRFYGCGPTIWYNSTADGANWNGYINTNLTGGDPGIVKLPDNSYLVLFVGQPYAVVPAPVITDNFIVYSNPSSSILKIGKDNTVISYYSIYAASGQFLMSGNVSSTGTVNIAELASGIYFIKITQKGVDKTLRFFKAGK